MNIRMDAASSRRKWGKGRVAVLGVVAATVLAACGSSSSSSSASSAPTTSSASGGASATPYVIHALVSQTGSAAFLGSREAKALQALASQVNASGGIKGHPLQIDIQDNQSSPQTSVQYATKLVSANVPFLLNGSVVAVDKAVDALAGSSGPFVYDLSPGTHPAPGSMVFSAGISTKFDAESYLTYLKAKGLTNIAAITSTDGSGVDGFKQLQTALAEPKFSSFHLLTHQTFDPTAVSVTTQMSVIKAQKPQALIVWTTGTPLGLVLNAMSSLGMENLPTVTTDGNAAYAELTHFASILPKTLYFPTAALYLPPANITNPAVKAKVEAFDKAVQAAGGHPGDAWGLSWDPAQLLIGAVEKLGLNATATQIQKYMENLQNVAGIYGVYNTSNSNHRGLNTSDVYMTVWNGSSFTQVSGSGGSPMATSGSSSTTAG